MFIEASIVRGIGQGNFPWPVYIFNGEVSRFQTAEELIHLAWRNCSSNQSVAIACLERAMKLLPDDPYLFNQCALVNLAMNRHQEALQCLDHAIELAPELFFLQLNRGNALMMLGYFDGACSSVEKAIKLTRESGEKAFCLFQYGLFCLQKKLYFGAALALSDACALQPASKKYRDSLNLACMLRAMESESEEKTK